MSSSDRGDLPGSVRRAGPADPISRGSALAERAADAERLADRLVHVQQRISGLSKNGDDRMWLQLRFLSVCDALKARRASVGSCCRRLDRLMADVDRIESR